MARRFFVTGGAGFIGSHLVDALRARGDVVVVLDNLSTGARDNLASASEVELIEGDLNDSAALQRALAGVDCVFHLAALPSVPLSIADPLATHLHCSTGTLSLLQAAVGAGVRRVVYAGSSSAYGDRRQAAAKRESDSPAPISPYAVAKLSGEMYCRVFYECHGLETVSLRYFNVFGPRQNPRSQYSAVIPRFITAMLEGRPPVIFGDGRQSRDFTYVANVVDANLRAADAEAVAGQTLNVANGQSFDLLTLVAMLNELLGTELAPQHEPARAGDVRDSLADISRARELLGYRPQVSFQQGLERCIAYYQQQGSS